MSASDDLKVVAVVKASFGEALVLNRPLRFIYESDGAGGFIGRDGAFTDLLRFKQATARFKAFAGREITIRLTDGTKKTLKDHWWHSHSEGSASIAYGDIESLKKCYVFGGMACISHEDLYPLRVAYEGCVYPYWEYEKVIKFDDMRKELYGKIFHEECRNKSLVAKVKELAAQLSKEPT